eukprot:1453411-Rhodomonas_salina.1
MACGIGAEPLPVNLTATSKCWSVAMSCGGCTTTLRCSSLWEDTVNGSREKPITDAAERNGA